MDYYFVQNKRAMVIYDFLVVGDLHIGRSKSMESKGYSIPNQMKVFLKEIKELKKVTKAKNLVLLGDIKDNIPEISYIEKLGIPDFFYELSNLFENVYVAKGNHDGRIELLIHPKNVIVAKEIIYKDVVFVHGHSWPTKETMASCKILVSGHQHPVFKIKDRMGLKHYYPCWTICSFNKSKIKRFKKISIDTVILVPPFNPLFGGTEKFFGPLAKALRKKEIFLLDLTKVK